MHKQIKVVREAKLDTFTFWRTGEIFGKGQLKFQGSFFADCWPSVTAFQIFRDLYYIYPAAVLIIYLAVKDF